MKPPDQSPEPVDAVPDPPWVRLPETPASVDFHQHRIELNEKLRAAYLAGAEERMRRDHGRGLTDAELRMVMQEYPGDLPTKA